MVFLASKLSQPAQLQLAKLGQLLGGRMADTFSGLGSVCVIQTQPPRGAYTSSMFQAKPLRLWSHRIAFFNVVICDTWALSNTAN